MSVTKFKIGKNERAHYILTDNIFWSTGLPVNGNILCVDVEPISIEGLSKALDFCFSFAKRANSGVSKNGYEACEWLKYFPDVNAGNIVEWPGVEQNLLLIGGDYNLLNKVIAHVNCREISGGAWKMAPDLSEFTIKPLATQTKSAEETEEKTSPPIQEAKPEEKPKNKAEDFVKFLGFAFEINGEIRIIK